MIRSSQLMANNQVNQPVTPKACHKRKVSASEVLPTPQNKQEFLKAIHAVSGQVALPRSVRRLLFKTGKAFDTLHHQHSQDSLQIQAQQKKIDELANKRRKKIAIDCNKVFADISRIKAAKD